MPISSRVEFEFLHLTVRRMWKSLSARGYAVGIKKIALFLLIMLCGFIQHATAQTDVVQMKSGSTTFRLQKGTLFAVFQDRILWKLNRIRPILRFNKYNEAFFISSIYNKNILYLLQNESDLIAVNVKSGKIIWRKHVSQHNSIYLTKNRINAILIKKNSNMSIISINKKSLNSWKREITLEDSSNQFSFADEILIVQNTLVGTTIYYHSEAYSLEDGSKIPFEANYIEKYGNILFGQTNNMPNSDFAIYGWYNLKTGESGEFGDSSNSANSFVYKGSICKENGDFGQLSITERYAAILKESSCGLIWYIYEFEAGVPFSIVLAKSKNEKKPIGW